MRLVVQRVKNAKVTVDNRVTGKINQGFLVLLGVTHSDTKETADFLVKKLCNLRVFKDENDKMNLYADCQKGNRPSFVNSAKPEYANELYEYFVSETRKEVKNVQTGEFGAHMDVELLNDGPVTIILEK